MTKFSLLIRFKIKRYGCIYESLSISVYLQLWCGCVMLLSSVSSAVTMYATPRGHQTAGERDTTEPRGKL